MRVTSKDSNMTLLPIKFLFSIAHAADMLFST